MTFFVVKILKTYRYLYRNRIPFLMTVSNGVGLTDFITEILAVN